MKRCTLCGENLPFEQFYFNRAARRYDSYCKACRAKRQYDYNKRWQQVNAARFSVIKRRYYETHKAEFAERNRLRYRMKHPHANL